MDLGAALVLYDKSYDKNPCVEGVPQMCLIAAGEKGARLYWLFSKADRKDGL